MAKSTVSPLSAGLVVKKGQAAASAHVKEVETKPFTAPSPAADSGEEKVSMTVKISQSQFEALKLAGAMQRKKSQQIFIEALDAWLIQNTDK